MSPTYLAAVALVEGNGGTPTDVARRERWRWEQQWRETYAQGVKQRTGQWVLDDFDWHAFSSGITPCERGFQARETYLRQPPERLVVPPRSSELPAFSYFDAGPIDFSSCLLDLLVFPTDLRWTMAFTHEQPDFGPFFSMATWCVIA